MTAVADTDTDTDSVSAAGAVVPKVPSVAAVAGSQQQSEVMAEIEAKRMEDIRRTKDRISDMRRNRHLPPLLEEHDLIQRSLHDVIKNPTDMEYNSKVANSVQLQPPQRISKDVPQPQEDLYAHELHSDEVPPSQKHGSKNVEHDNLSETKSEIELADEESAPENCDSERCYPGGGHPHSIHEHDHDLFDIVRKKEMDRVRDRELFQGGNEQLDIPKAKEDVEIVKKVKSSPHETLHRKGEILIINLMPLCTEYVLSLALTAILRSLL